MWLRHFLIDKKYDAWEATCKGCGCTQICHQRDGYDALVEIKQLEWAMINWELYCPDCVDNFKL